MPVAQRPRTEKPRLEFAKGARLEYIGPDPLEAEAWDHPIFWEEHRILDVTPDARMPGRYVTVHLEQSKHRYNVVRTPKLLWQVLKKEDWRVIGYE